MEQSATGEEFESAHSIEQLRMIFARMSDMVRHATRTGGDIKSVTKLISHYNDAITTRLIALLDLDEGIRLPEGATYLALGSEGRGEQTLRTDQDSAIVHADDLPADRLAEAERFAVRLAAALEALGVPRCPGNTMASNPRWRHSLSQWKHLLDLWISVPTPEHMAEFSMFQDLRALHGDETLGRQLCEHIRQSVQYNTSFLSNMAHFVVRFQPPLGMFGRIKVERSGEQRGKVDIKKGGIFAITIGASLLSLEAGIVGGNTWDKLERLGQLGLIAPGDLGEVEESFNCLVRLRLQQQLLAVDSGAEPSNCVDPVSMVEAERERLRQALKGVGVFLQIIRDHYQLELVSR